MLKFPSPPSKPGLFASSLSFLSFPIIDIVSSHMSDSSFATPLRPYHHFLNLVNELNSNSFGDVKGRLRTISKQDWEIATEQMEMADWLSKGVVKKIKPTKALIIALEILIQRGNDKVSQMSLDIASYDTVECD